MTLRNYTFVASIVALLSGLASEASAQICSGCSLTVAGDEAPKVQPWTQPAGFAYVNSSVEGDDRATLDLAVKYQTPFNTPLSLPGLGDADNWFVRGVAHVSDQEAKQQESFSLGVGVHFDRAFLPANYTIEDVDRAWYLRTDLSVAAASKVTFPDLASAECVTDPSLVICGEQTQRSVRFLVDLGLYNREHESKNTVVDTDGDGDLDSSDWVTSFGPPTVRLFYDEVADAVVNEFGEETGGVFGARVIVGFAASPPVFQNRIVFRTSYQRILAFSVSDERANSFPDDADLFTASLDFELGHRSFQSGPGWQPSIGINYSSGADPLDGRLEKEETTIGFRLTHKGS